jgi:carboxyl-terminal processing protease
MAEMMLGEVGTDVEIVIARNGVANPIRFKLTREIIRLGTARLSYERDVPVISISAFSEQTYKGLEHAIRQVALGARKLPTGIILDLRNNSGGPLDQAQDVSDAFLARGAIFYAQGRDKSQMKRYEAAPDELDELIANVPVVVLINGGTASAAEIVSGALQDHCRATLVGTRSFGKGVAQSIFPLGENGAMNLTTARLYTPSNRSIQALGIMPDIEVLQTIPEAFRGKDVIAGEAGLERHLPGEQGEATVRSSAYVPVNRAEDDQLQYAVKLILGQVHHKAFPPDPDKPSTRQ